MKSLAKKIISLLLIVVFCCLTSTATFAAEIDSNNTNIIGNSKISARAMDYNYGTGYAGTFTVNLSSGGNYGQIVIRIQSPSQDNVIGIRVRDRSGRTVWYRDVEAGGGLLKPQNGAEQKSPVFSNCLDGAYTVQFTSLDNIRLDCWVCSW